MAKKESFDPMDREFLFSRTALDEFVECPRCFYFSRRLGHARPGGGMSGLPGAVEKLMRQELDGYRARHEQHPVMADLPGDLIPFDHPSLGDWRKSKPGIRLAHAGSGFLLSGAPDDVKQALLEGARWWNQAFEAAGFSNAFKVDVLPADADRYSEHLTRLDPAARRTVIVAENPSAIRAVELAAARFGGIDILVNNASAIQLGGTLATPLRRFDLMLGVNTRGTYACSQACLPHLLKAANPHILNLSPPLSMQAKWFKDHTAYTISKYGMSMCTLGMAAEFADRGVAVNSLWPRTTIATAAIEFNFPEAILKACRHPAIVADAAHAIFLRDSRAHTGNFYIDEAVLQAEGITDFAQYAVTPGGRLYTDLFLD